MSGIITLHSLLFSLSTLWPAWAMGHFLKKRSAEKMILHHKREKGANLRYKDSRWIYVYMPVDVFEVLSLWLFSQNGYLFCFCCLRDWVNTFYNTKVPFRIEFRLTVSVVLIRRFKIGSVFLYVWEDILSVKKQKHLYLFITFFSPPASPRPPCQELMVECVRRARAVCLNVKTIRSRMLQGHGWHPALRERRFTTVPLEVYFFLEHNGN